MGDPNLVASAFSTMVLLAGEELDEDDGDLPIGIGA